MTALAPLLHTGSVGQRPVRFFRSPLEGPDMPWHSVDDLYTALAFPRPLRRHFKQMLQGQWKDDVRTVATSDGITTIAPHYMAQGLIQSLKDVPQATQPKAEVEYQVAVAGAMDAMTQHMPADAKVNYLVEAFKRMGQQ